ncbi:hypothetical protein NIES4103_54660 [Nostoc sp. NIES-4103]|nr:hypothetical protein NIES4103_54660 [Nostoc sp. NIES-4103]
MLINLTFHFIFAQWGFYIKYIIYVSYINYGIEIRPDGNIEP